MSLTIDCGEGKHDICAGSGTDAYLIPQLAGEWFNCGCRCHHDGQGVPCPECPSVDPQLLPGGET